MDCCSFRSLCGGLFGAVPQDRSTKCTTKLADKDFPIGVRRGKKQRSPPGFRPAGTKVGDGSSPCSLSRAGIWRPKGCRLPDAILHGKRNCGLIAGPSSALRSLGFRVRPLSSLGLAFAAPACEPDKDTFVTLAPRLYHLTPGRPPLVAVRWPGVTGLTSYLSGCIWLTSQRCFFTSPAYWKGRVLAWTHFLPGPHAQFVRLSAFFIWRLG